MIVKQPLKPPYVEGALELAEGQYHKEEHPKDKIVLHHTVSGEWPGTVKFWGRDSARVGTAFGIDRDGTVYRAFPPQFWAVHLFRFRDGPTESTGVFNDTEALRLEKNSIGIELVSYGALSERNGKLYNAYDKPLGPTKLLVDGKQVYDHGSEWRGHRYYQAYTEEQVVSTIKLVAEMCRIFRIPAIVPKEIIYAGGDPRTWLSFRGIVSHAQLRKDKSDTHPGFPYARLAYALSGIVW